MQLKVKKLTPLAKLPRRGTAQSAGLDLFAFIRNKDDSVLVPPHENAQIGTGLAIAVPEGYFGAIFARSGIASKFSIRPANCVGVIDSDYRGEILITVHNDADEARTIRNGARIAQLVLIPYAAAEPAEVEALEETERGEGGFGSTGE